MTGAPIQTFSEQKRPGESLDYVLDVRAELERRWRPNREYGLGDWVRSTPPNGWDYECTDAGRSDSRQPSWPTVAGRTRVDGSVVWTCRESGTNAVDTIAGLVGVAAPAGISAVHLATDARGEARIRVGGGTAGQDYSVLLTVSTVSGQVLVYELVVEVRE
jgi:hypothetical protein